MWYVECMCEGKWKIVRVTDDREIAVMEYRELCVGGDEYRVREAGKAETRVSLP